MSNAKALALEFEAILSLNVETSHKDSFMLNKDRMKWIESYVQKDHGDSYNNKIQECYSFVPLSHGDIISCKGTCKREEISDEKCFTNDNQSFSKCIGELKAEIDSSVANEL